MLDHLARKYENVRKGVSEVMGGQILEYESKTMYNKGRIEGRNEGIEQANIATAKRMLLGGMKISVVVEMTSLPQKQIEGIKDEMAKKGLLKENLKKDRGRGENR